MSASELAALVVVVTASVAVAVLVLLSWDLHRAAERMRRSAQVLDDQASVLIKDLQTTLAEAQRSLGRAEDQLERTGQVVEVIEEASKLTYRTVARPVIKAAAMANGVRRGAEFLRGGPRLENGSAPALPSRSGSGEDGAPGSGRRDSGSRDGMGHAR